MGVVDNENAADRGREYIEEAEQMLALTRIGQETITEILATPSSSAAQVLPICADCCSCRAAHLH